MAKENENYICKTCGLKVQVVNSANGQLMCCNQKMELETVSEDNIHKLDLVKDGNLITITVGDGNHPMTEDHHIKWIEISVDGCVYVKRFYPGEVPKAEFKLQGAKISARALCNLHGVFKTNF